MLKRIILLVPVVMAGIYIFSWLQPDRSIHFYGNADFSEAGGLLYYRSQPFTGVARETFPDGSTFRTTEYKSGLRHGTSEEFGVTGARRARWNYKSGKKEGLQQGWFIEGPRKFEMYYRDGLLEGTTTEWYLSGRISRQQTFKAGVEMAQKILYPSGEIFTNYVIRDKRAYGLKSGELCMDFKKDGEI
jgi:antitoxin component YwqK of YwqJK toxin-antitoxin module